MYCSFTLIDLIMQLDALTLVNEPTHILPNFSSCIDFIFTDQPSLAVNSGTHPSLYANYHHQITYCKLNLKIECPPPYQRLARKFTKATITSIRKAIHTVNWGFLSFNKNAHEQFSIFKNTLIFFPIIYQTNLWQLMTKIALG